MARRWLRRTFYRVRTVGAVAWTLLWLFAGAAVNAEPMDLRDPTPRWVSVQFEISPASAPGQRDTFYSRSLPAWLEPAGDGRVRLTIEGQVVERHLMGKQVPVPGSFSDFEWIFDAESGQVLSASFRGKLTSEVRLGRFSTDVYSGVEVRMNTATEAGYAAARDVMQHRFHPYCERNQRDDGCTLVAPSRYQAHTGYVNAVGELVVEAPFVRLRTFSPLGEARFSEVPDWPQAEPELTRPALHAPSAVDELTPHALAQDDSTR